MTTGHKENLQAWKNDAAALREESARAVPGIDHTAALLSRAARAASTQTKKPKENQLMSIARNKPFVFATAAFVTLLVLSGAAYAVVNKLFLTIDPEKPEEVIEDDLREQLEDIGVESASVKVEKTEMGNGTQQLSVEIGSDDEGAFDKLDVLDNLSVKVEGRDYEAIQTRVALDLQDGALSDAETAELLDLVHGDAFLEIMTARSPEMSDAEYAAMLESFFADHGFPNLTAEVKGESATLSIKQ